MLIPTVGTLVIRNGVVAVLFLDDLKIACKVRETNPFVFVYG